jgi:hypothetical protein
MMTDKLNPLKHISTQELHDELERRRIESTKIKVHDELEKVKAWAPSPTGLWKVTTEGDCEGRSTKDLGIHEGHIADIAFALSNQVFYKLCFSPAKIVDIHNVRDIRDVSISLDIGSKTWDLKPDDRVSVISSFLHSSLSRRLYDVRVGSDYAAVLLQKIPEGNRDE